MQSRRLGLILACSILTVGCASLQPTPRTPAAVIKDVTETAKEAATNALSARNLAAGQCGLFLFTRTDPARLIFFYSADSESAAFHDGQAEYDLSLEAANGALFGQFFTQMAFSAPNGQNISVTYKAGAAMNGGARINSGRIIVTDAEGWEVIIPIAGVRACQPDDAGRA